MCAPGPKETYRTTLSASWGREAWGRWSQGAMLGMQPKLGRQKQLFHRERGM